MTAKILLALFSILEVVKLYFSKKKDEAENVKAKLDVDFQSEVELTAAKAEKPETKDESIKKMREFLAE